MISKKISDKTYYDKLKKEGKCTQCWRDRGEDGTTILCRSCADKCADRSRKRRERRKALGLCAQCGQRRALGGNLCKICQQKSLLSLAKYRAKKRGLPFDLTIDDLEWETCPVLGIPLIFGNRSMQDNSPSLDRLIPKKGYVKENVCVISFRANKIKQDATLEEIYKVADWMKQRFDERQNI